MNVLPRSGNVWRVIAPLTAALSMAAMGCDVEPTKPTYGYGISVRGNVYSATDTTLLSDAVVTFYSTIGSRGADTDSTGPDGHYDVFANLREGENKNVWSVSKPGYVSQAGSFWVIDLDPGVIHIFTIDRYLLPVP